MQRGEYGEGLSKFAINSCAANLFDDHGESTRTADETRSKPDPLMLHELMRQFGTDPDRTLMIGDTTHDLQLAANAGTPSVAVAYGAHAPSEFATHSPLIVAKTVAELAAWLDEHA